jgi:hypothetical protein
MNNHRENVELNPGLIGGVVGGALLGSIVGPGGLLVGGVLGGAVVNALQEKLKQPDQITSLPKPINDNKILVLVINAQQEEILNSLSSNLKVTADDCENLYRATKYLWMGTQAEFSQSELKEWFDSPCEVQESEQSEYDVKLVQIDLEKSHPGFEQQAINRLPAFRELPDNSRFLKISPRLSSKAYENPQLYR